MSPCPLPMPPRISNPGSRPWIPTHRQIGWILALIFLGMLACCAVATWVFLSDPVQDALRDVAENFEFYRQNLGAGGFLTGP